MSTKQYVYSSFRKRKTTDPACGCTKGTKTYKKSNSITPYVKRYIARKIASTEEVKTTNYNQAGVQVQPYNTGVTSTSWYLQCVFPVSPYGSTVLAPVQGTGAGDRLGNKIKTKGLKMKFILTPAPYNATTNQVPQPYNVRMWVVCAKYDNATLPTQNSFQNFFQFGDTSVALQSTLSDMTLDVNTDLFTVYYDKVFKVGSAANTGTGGSAVSQYGSNNDYSYNVIEEIDLYKACPKTMIFNDTNSFPNNRCLFCVIAAAPALGGSVATTQLPLNLWYSLSYKFTDA